MQAMRIYHMLNVKDVLKSCCTRDNPGYEVGRRVGKGINMEEYKPMPLKEFIKKAKKCVRRRYSKKQKETIIKKANQWLDEYQLSPTGRE